MVLEAVTDIEKARRIADEIRPFWPEKAAEIDAVIASYSDGPREPLKIDVSVAFRLQKFEGDYRPDKVPLETIEMEG